MIADIILFAGVLQAMYLGGCSVSPSEIFVSSVIVHVTLAIFLFYLINWVGEYSSSFGYLQLSLFVRRDEAPAFNFVLKALAPAAYVILVATTFYVLQLNRFVERIWLVAAYYFAFRLFYNLFLGRWLLFNWLSFSAQSAVGISATYVAYQHLILPRHPLFPSIESIGNQLWIIVALFLYATLNNVRTSGESSARRKNRYVRSQFNNARQRYGKLIEGHFTERYMELVAYAIVVYEAFNRPWLARAVERAIFPWVSRTIGPMQVHTEKPLSDRDGVVLGVQQLTKAFAATIQELAGKPASRYSVIRLTVAKYNRDENYINEVLQVLHILWAQVVTDYRTEFETMYVTPSGA